MYEKQMKRNNLLILVKKIIFITILMLKSLELTITSFVLKKLEFKGRDYNIVISMMNYFILKK